MFSVDPVEFKRDIVELLAQKVAGEFGKAASEMAPEAIKLKVIEILGGKDGKIGDLKAEALTAIPKFLFKGTTLEESGQSFMRELLKDLQRYEVNPSADRTVRLANIGDIIVAALNNNKAPIINKKLSYAEALATLPAFECQRLIVLMNDLHDIKQPNGSPHPLYLRLEKLSHERTVERESLHLVLVQLGLGREDLALAELLRVLTNAPLLNPPKAPPGPPSKLKVAVDDLVKHGREAIETLADKTVLVDHVVVRGDTVEALATRFQVTSRMIRSMNHLTSDALVVGSVLSIPQGPLSEPFRALEARNASRRELLNK